MTIEKMPSGSYRIRKQFNGKRITVVVPYKPTQKEAMQLIAEKCNDTHDKHKRMSFADGCRQYASDKENILSPRTIREYLLYINRLPKWFTSKDIYLIDQLDVQRCINELAQDKAPKTVYTLHGFISAVLKHFRPNTILNTTLPQKRKIEPNIPIEDEVKVILQYTKDNFPHYYVALVLACYSCRRSEICALKYPDDYDFEKNAVIINKALVEDKNGNWVNKVTKTTESTRIILLPDDVATIIKNQKCIYNGAPQSISNYLRRTQDKLNMEHFSLHKLRHYFASKMMDMGIDQKTIQEMGGWSNPQTLNNIYQHSLKVKDERKRKLLTNEFAKAIL